MAEHDVQYWSESRGEGVDIGAMPTRHLSNAAKKTAKAIAEGVDGVDVLFQPDGSELLVVLSAMIDELASRVPATGSAS